MRLTIGFGIAAAVAVMVCVRAAVSAQTPVGMPISDQQVTANNDNVRCQRQPCSPDGKWQATVLTLRVGPVDSQYHLENVTLASDGSTYARFCDILASENQLTYATKAVRCWSGPVTWTLTANVVKS